MKQRLVLIGTSLLKALAPGERWLTVHPNGRDDKGVHVLVQVQKDGSAKVIGGAGGALNHLRLTGVRSEAQYREEAAQRAQEHRAREKERRKADREKGLTPSKDEATHAVRAQERAHEDAFVKQVGDALGWTEAETRFPEEQFSGATEAEKTRARNAHAQMLLSRAREAVGMQRKRLLADADLRRKAGLGEVPMASESDQTISMQDLDPSAPSGGGLGFTAHYRDRAEANGLTPEGLEQEVNEAREASLPEGLPKVTADRIGRELDKVRENPPPLKAGWEIDGRRAIDLLRAEKTLKTAKADARKKLREISTSEAPVEPKSFVIEAQPASHGAVAADIEKDLRTIGTRSFLNEASRMGGREALERHVASGAYNAMNALSLASTGASQMDRSVVDVLGIAGAAQVLAQRMHGDLSPGDMADAATAMERFHTDHYMDTSRRALADAREMHDQAQAIDLSPAMDASDLTVAQELNTKRKDLVSGAQRRLGTAYGEMEANAAMVMAMKQGRKDHVQVPMGKTSLETAIVQLHALGLQKGDYEVGKAGASTIVTLNRSGIERLTKPVDPQDLAHVRGALDIIEGRHDEDGWLPHGVANRPDMAMDSQPGVLPRLAAPYATPDDTTSVEGHEAAIRSFIGSRIADGETPAKALADLLSETTMRRAGDRQAFMQALGRQAPQYDAAGNMVRAEEHRPRFEEMADEHVASLGGARTSLQRQNFPVDETSVDALHRALAEHPDGAAAFKPIGDLTDAERRGLRARFAEDFARSDPKVAQMRADLEAHAGQEPERETQDMFGTSVNPQWRDWKKAHDEKAAVLDRATMSWGKYSDAMGGPANAYAAMQDVARSHVIGRFADHYNRLRPDAPLAVGKTVIAHDLRHLDALDPGARERRMAEHRERIDALRQRENGRYAAGGVADRLDAARAAEEGRGEAQMQFFGADAAPSPVGAEGPALGERWSVGHAAEQTIAQMMPHVGSQFRAGQPVKLWRPDMSGRFVGRQRAVKLIEHNRRVVAGLGVGSGKTSIGLAGFTHLQGQGKAKRGLFLVPSIVQGQFHGEALTLLQPGKFRWHADPSANREQRIAAYKNPDVHFSVVTHQAFRDDVLHMAAGQEGVSPAEITQKLDGMDADGRMNYVRGVLDREGIHHDYLNVDEGHNLLNRAGKKNSSLANVVDAVADSTPYYVNMTADPVKNDASEAFDVLSKMDRKRYGDRDAFMRKYGGDTSAAREGLRREMARHFYTGRIASGVNATKTEEVVPLGAAERSRLAEVEQASARARIARMKGDVDVEAMKKLAPAAFSAADDADHRAIAERMNPSIGILRNTAIMQALGGEAKTNRTVTVAEQRRGRPGVVFARSLDRVHDIASRLRAEGHRVVTLTGADSSAEKDRKKRAYQAGEHDIMVASDAAAVGANLQRGKWLAQYDTPQTAMLHAQRDGRINRVGQTSDVELIDILADHPVERRNRRRLTEKYNLRDIVTSPLEGLDETGIAGYLHQARSERRDHASRAA
ncbi:helicase-related protein [Novacetimonas hansenii]|uniref:helicase-related protein n=1 Tax=Novacetimonas hansenii TaxID=436 RepID=UPI00131EFAB5|nr:helicase-related protein [Novacetimonas hansenii]